MILLLSLSISGLNLVMHHWKVLLKTSLPYCIHNEYCSKWFLYIYCLIVFIIFWRKKCYFTRTLPSNLWTLHCKACRYSQITKVPDIKFKYIYCLKKVEVYLDFSICKFDGSNILHHSFSCEFNQNYVISFSCIDTHRWSATYWWLRDKNTRRISLAFSWRSRYILCSAFLHINTKNEREK